jgi:two-component system chemotaxis response regulator CheY
MEPMRQILIVDDSPTIRRMVRASLTQLGGSVEFVEAGSGLEAIERLALGAIRLMVLDLNMPDMHGLEVLGFVRSHQKYRNVPIIVLTTRGDDASRSAALQAGATAYLTKPFAPQALATEVRQLLGASDSQHRAGRPA